MNDGLRHRGPDGQGFYRDEESGVYLGHNRLAVIDLSAQAAQPFYNEDKSIAAVINGEIYNFADLKKELLLKGHRFYSLADAEIIVHAYEEWREDFVSHLRGMFACALWDKNEKKLILARDHLGVKPLYYLQKDGYFAFASEAKAFLKLASVDYVPQINQKAIEFLLAFPFLCDNRMTIFEGVDKLPAGHILIFQNNETYLRKYWQLENKGCLISNFQEASGRFEEKIKESVRLHLQSDVEVGVLLSGGVDSGLIAALASRAAQKPIRAFTAGFNRPHDEIGEAKALAGHLGFLHTEFVFDCGEIGSRMERLVGCFDDLSCLDGGMITTALIAEQIKKFNIKVVLSGEGADEIFGGYPWFVLSQRPFSFLPPFLRRSLYYQRISKSFLNSHGLRQNGAFNRLLGSFGERDIFREISQFEITYQLPNHFLMKVDKGAMTHGLEVRVPYVDKEIVEFAYGLPARFKRRGSKDKCLLRQAAAKYLPLKAAWRRKRGFFLPVAEILNKNKEKVRSYLLGSKRLTQGFLSKSEITALLGLHESRIPFASKSAESLIWKIFVMEVWHREYLAQKDGLL